MKKLLMVCASFVLLMQGALAAIVTEKVEYEHEGDKLTGYLMYDDATKDKRPGVVVYHEWWGLNDHAQNRTKALAELGYVAFAADMYGGNKVTDKPSQAQEWMQEITADAEFWRERAAAGLAQLQKSELVDQSKIAAIGYCFGGGTVLQMAYAGTDIQGVVSFHGSLPIVGKEDNIKTKILAAHGNADSFIAREILEQFQQELDKTDADWQLINYGHARHAFTNPNAGKYGVENLQYNEKADKRSWLAMQQFFAEIFE